MDPAKLGGTQLSRCLPHFALPTDDAIGNWPNPTYFDVPSNIRSDLGHYYFSASERTINYGPMLGPNMGIDLQPIYDRPVTASQQEQSDRVLLERSLQQLFTSGSITMEAGRGQGAAPAVLETAKMNTNEPRTVLDTLTVSRQAAMDIANKTEAEQTTTYRVRTKQEVLREIREGFKAAHEPLDQLRHPVNPDLHAVESFDLLPSDKIGEHQLVLLSAEAQGRSFYRATTTKKVGDNVATRRPGALLELTDPLSPNQLREKTSEVTRVHVPGQGIGLGELEAAVAQQLALHPMEDVLPTEQGAQFTTVRSSHTLMRPRWRLYTISLDPETHTAGFTPVSYTMTQVASTIDESAERLHVQLGVPDDAEDAAEESFLDLDAPVDDAAFNPENFVPK